MNSEDYAMVSCNDMKNIRDRLRDERGRFTHDKRMVPPSDEAQEAATKAAVNELSAAAGARFASLGIPPNIMAGDFAAMKLAIDRRFDRPEINAARSAVKIENPYADEIERLFHEGHDIVAAMQAWNLEQPYEQELVTSK